MGTGGGNRHANYGFRVVAAAGQAVVFLVGDHGVE
jgi:hypothetical protein